MIICTKCGHQNAENVRFCAGCGSFLDWTGHKSPKEESFSLALKVTPGDVMVEPGGQALCEARIRNTGTIVDEFLIELSGDAVEWAVVEPARLRLFPGAEDVARITLRPPRSPMVRAGQKSFSVRVRSSAPERDKTTEQQSTITVGEFTALEATIVPQTSEAIETAEHTLMVRNEGNARAEVQIRASDPDDRLVFEVEPSSHAIEPGGSAASRLRVSRRPGVSRPEQRFPFQVLLQPAGAAALRLDGALVQQRAPAAPPARRGWRPWALALAGLAILLVAGIGVVTAASGGLNLLPVAHPAGGVMATVSPSASPAAAPTETPAPSPSQASGPAPTPRPTPTSTPPPTTPTPAPTPAIACSGSGTLHGTYIFDFDTCREASPGDVWWDQIDNVQRQLVPQNGASIALLGNVNFDSVTPAQLKSATYGTSGIDGSNNSQNRLVPGTVVAVRTRSGHYAKLRVDSYSYNLGITYVTYA